MRITPLVLAGSLLAAGFAGSADAATKKPINKSYEATAATPDVTNNLPSARYSVCEMTVPGSYHEHVFKAPAVGKMKVEMSGFTGDWDILLLDPKGTEIAMGGASDVGSPATPAKETMSGKIRKAGSYKIIACNFAGGPTAQVKYTFTYA